MTDDVMRQTLANYVLSDAIGGSPNGERQFAARETVRTWIEADPEQAWRFIEAAYQSEISDEELAAVAAGALEDFLAAHGDKFFDRLETAVRRDARARFMAAGVWQGGMSNVLWGRFVELRERLGIKAV